LGKKKFIKKLLKKYGVSFEDVKRGRYDEVYEEALKRVLKIKKLQSIKNGEKKIER